MAPFGLAIVPLALCGLLVTYGWKENYGDAKLDVFSGLGNAWQVIRSDPRVMYLGIAQSAFEGSMYTFVFMWTPAIATAETKTTLPYGTIFAVFMVCCALGSSLFSYALRKGVDILTVPKYGACRLRFMLARPHCRAAPLVLAHATRRCGGSLRSSPTT
jgi:hypothetical protein